jgi:hypothetical protein
MELSKDRAVNRGIHVDGFAIGEYFAGILELDLGVRLHQLAPDLFAVVDPKVVGVIAFQGDPSDWPEDDEEPTPEVA